MKPRNYSKVRIDTPDVVRARWEAMAKPSLSDFKVGDVIIVTENTKVCGRRSLEAVVTAVDYNGNGLVTYSGSETGQGAFDPTKVGTTEYGFVVAVTRTGRSRSPFVCAVNTWSC